MTKLSDLRVGDEVVVHPLRDGASPRIAKIGRMTARSIIVGGMKYRRSDGLGVGHGTSTIAPVTPDSRAKAEASIRLARVSDLINRLVASRRKSFLTAEDEAMLAAIVAKVEAAE